MKSFSFDGDDNAIQNLDVGETLTDSFTIRATG